MYDSGESQFSKVHLTPAQQDLPATIKHPIMATRSESRFLSQNVPESAKPKPWFV